VGIVAGIMHEFSTAAKKPFAQPALHEPQAGGVGLQRTVQYVCGGFGRASCQAGVLAAS
jgi:hypothetical protein